MKKTLIMVLLAIALGAYVWIYEIEGEEQRQAEKELQEKLVSLEKDSIKTLTIWDFETTYRFEKINAKWHITSPVNTDADESVVTGYLSSLTNAKTNRTFSSDVTGKATYGLLKPSIGVKVVDMNGKADSLYFGDKTGIGEEMYISKSPGDSIIGITPISLKNNTQKPLLTWRNKKAIQFDKNSVYSFSLTTAKNTFTFEKNGNNWNLTEPLKTKSDNSAVNAILNKLDFGQIKSVETEQAENLSRYKLAKPAYKVELFSAGNVKQGSVVFSPLKDSQAYGKDSARPHVFTVDSIYMNVFNKTLFELRDKDLVDFTVDKINRINLLFGENVLTFTKDTTGSWLLANGEPIKSAKIDDLVNAIQNMKVDLFVAENPSYLLPYGLTTPKGSIELFADSSKEVELEFGIEKDGQRYIRNTRTGQVVAIKTDKLDKVLITRDDVIESLEEQEQQ